jgi:long-chain acyl-CoA synthetase
VSYLYLSLATAAAAEDQLRFGERGLPGDIPLLVARDEVRVLIQAELDRANAKYAQVEQIKKFELLDHDLSQAAGEMTPTQKVKRSVINARCADLFERMYDQGERA